MTKKSENGTDPKPKRDRKPRKDSAAVKLDAVLERVNGAVAIITGEDRPGSDDIDRVLLLLEEARVIGTGGDLEAWLREKVFGK